MQKVRSWAAVKKGVLDRVIGCGGTFVGCVPKKVVDDLSVGNVRYFGDAKTTSVGGEYLVLLGVRSESLPWDAMLVQMEWSSVSRSLFGREL